MKNMVIGSAAIWSGALHASASLLAGRADGAQWGIDQPGNAAWGPSAGQMAGTARGIVELAVHIVMELPDDPEAGVPQAKAAARRWLGSHGADLRQAGCRSSPPSVPPAS
jgi:hypothetical protein